ncbi:Gfo/Idh/MocA family oxidoreductase [Ruegeria sp. HKCCD7559]|uniref:Gfo/Idh/MocA family oxidoreductase n=1 Tax=Ruegeria sp. HKCCD7559 TaxID=2683005 RepID=UPI001492176E|nr:Gfo/Idh/MocA family oxidoreductase [Ruegeria sp. HKCCD7559]NOC47707.1 Gfo/Idh/MocA family oxidoreductase [Ruegeria sp. HKCCD7559]
MKHYPQPQTTTALARPVRMIQFGLGPHWERTINKHLSKMVGMGYAVSCPVGIDLSSNRKAVEKRLSECGTARPEEVFYIDPISPYHLDARSEAQLNRIVRKYNITAVAVSVPPEAHLGLALWALRNGLHLFLDKPVTTRPNAVNSLSAARGIFDDFEELNNVYAEAKVKHGICAMLNAQRPFMDAWVRNFEWVAETLAETGHPITNITAAHADGQMRVGNELTNVGYHGYLAGTGKLSHSGYHLIDVIVRMLKAGTWSHARPDYLLVRSSFRQPDALVTAMPNAEWARLFGEDCVGLADISDAELVMLGRRMGEVDAHVTIEAVRNGAVMTTANLHLQHDTVSARSTLETPKNWYKLAGRLKRELWHIDQGPMQSIRVETLQAEDKHDGRKSKGAQVGEPNHFELVRVQNDGLIKGAERLSRYNAADLTHDKGKYLLSERAKMASLTEFVSCAGGLLPTRQLTSDLSAHRLGVAIMAAAYESHVRRGSDRMGAATVRVDWTE